MAFLYGLAFTIDDDMKPARKYIILITTIFAAYEYFMHNYSENPTIFDFIYDKQPIFIQKNMIKNINLAIDH